MKIVWSSTAIADLESARRYIAQDSPESATRVAGRIVDAVKQLDHFPLSGRPGRLPGTRELIIAGTPYLVAYTVGEKEVNIAAILHGKQRWPEEI